MATLVITQVTKYHKVKTAQKTFGSSFGAENPHALIIRTR